MIALKIQDTKKMMQALLYAGSFDAFALQEASVIKDTSLFLEGRINKEYYTAKDCESSPALAKQDFCLWSSVKPVFMTFLKGEHTPLSFKFVLQAPASFLQKLLQNPAFTAEPEAVKALILTFHYENGSLTCLTGTAFTTFVMDKSLDKLWDSSIRKSLDKMGIAFEEL